MPSPLDRIKEYIDYKGLSIRSFEINTGFSNGSFASQLKNKKTIGVDKLENILHIYNEINPEWLLLGTGEMLRKTEQLGKKNKDFEKKEEEIITFLRESLEDKKELIAVQKDAIEIQKLALADKDKVIEGLENELKQTKKELEKWRKEENFAKKYEKTVAVQTVQSELTQK